jgi:hypothetical protein
VRVTPSSGPTTLARSTGSPSSPDKPLPPIPGWYNSNPTGNGVPYDGASFFNSGPLYAADAGRTHSLTLTFTKKGTFPYLDVGDVVLGMRDA